MLETLIKRSGQREAFSNEKSNNWFLWAANGLQDRMNWMSLIQETRNLSPEELDSQEWTLRLATACATRGATGDDGWPFMVAGGALLSVYYVKKIHGDGFPSLKDHIARVYSRGLIRKLDYSDDELNFMDEHILDHQKNFKLAHFQVEQYNNKYAIRDNRTKEVLETPQFTMMRMAMAVHEQAPRHMRMNLVRDQYLALQNDLINPPTPNYGGLGTTHFGLASCCLVSIDDTAESIAAGGLIAYMQTVSSAGLGIHLNLRSMGDEVDHGRVLHGGLLNYSKKLYWDTNANKQGVRGGAVTLYTNMFHPECEMMLRLQHALTPAAIRERGVNVAVQDNPFFARKVAEGGSIFQFTSFSAPDLYEAFFDPDQSEFERLYAQYEADDTFEKTYVDAYELAALFEQMRAEISTVFWQCVVETNRNTPYKDRVRSSNLCMEVCNPSSPFMSILDLYGDGHPSKGETGFCNIGSVAVHNLPFDMNNPKLGYQEYKNAVRQMANIIAYAIDNNNYRFPALSRQAKARRNASIGMSGIATLFAEQNLMYDTPKGLRAAHILAERHMYACIEVALEMGQELGNAEWINGPDNDGVHGTKWVDGWLPIDTYKREIDDYVDPTLVWDWEDLRRRVVANKGLYFSSLVAHMPGEQATRKGTGSNSVYPLFRLSLLKSDGSSSMRWAAKDNDLIGGNYQNAYTISPINMVIFYGVLQKFCDQSGSWDEYLDRSQGQPLVSDDRVEVYLMRRTVGLKTTYYQRTLSPEAVKAEDIVLNEAQVGAAFTPLIPLDPQDPTDKPVSAIDRIAAMARLHMETAAAEGSACSDDGACGA